MASAADVAAQMVAALAVSDPELDTSVGTPVRKILDVVAESVAAAYVDQHLLNYQLDIDSKRGADLDDFVATYGFTRFAAQRGTGVVTFARPTPADQDYPIAAGTQVTTATSVPAVFATVSPAILQRSVSSVDVPVQAIVGGQSGNLAANTLVRLASPASGVASVTNSSPTTGGTSSEDDLALIDRFKRTVFRSLAGTEDMFLGLSLEDSTPDTTDDGVATRARVIGSSSHWREQVQIDGSGDATSSIPATSATYIYADNPALGADLDAGQLLTLGVHYSFDATVIPPEVHTIGAGLTDGSIYDLDFEYNSSASRNDPAAGITNRVDIWVDGDRPVDASETTYMRTARVFTSGSTDALFTGKFVRQGTVSTHPTAANIFMQLAFGPIDAFPSSLIIGGNTYVRGTDYWVVHDDTAYGYSPRSLFGLEWLAAHHPVNNAAASLQYSYNAIPRDVQERVERWRLVATDVRAHAAKRVLLRLNFAIMFVPGYDPAQVATALQASLAIFLAAKDFGSPVQVSDVIQVAHEVTGVDNIRLLTSAEPTTGGAYAIERVDSAGTRISFITAGSSPARAADVQLGDNEVPALYSINYVAKAANSFGVS